MRSTVTARGFFASLHLRAFARAPIEVCSKLAASRSSACPPGVSRGVAVGVSGICTTPCIAHQTWWCWPTSWLAPPMRLLSVIPPWTLTEADLWSIPVLQPLTLDAVLACFNLSDVVVTTAPRATMKIAPVIPVKLGRFGSLAGSFFTGCEAQRCNIDSETSALQLRRMVMALRARGSQNSSYELERGSRVVWFDRLTVLYGDME
jgi:hypothetical protein